MRLIPGMLARLGVVSMAAALTTLAAVPASAAAPGNDTFTGAVAIGSVPFSTTQDTTEATTDALDAEANPAICGAPATDASVWYDITSATGEAFLVDVSKSDYSAGVLVVAGSPGAFEFVTCGPRAVAFETVAGTTYHLLVIDDQRDGGGNGGTLNLSVSVAPPPPVLDVTVDPTGSFNPVTGSATVHGTVSCSGKVEFAALFAEVQQQVGRGVVLGSGVINLRCDGTTQPWSVEVFPYFGTKFTGGMTATVAIGFACGPVFCSEDYEQHTVVLSRNG